LPGESEVISSHAINFESPCYPSTTSRGNFESPCYPTTTSCGNFESRSHLAATQNALFFSMLNVKQKPALESNRVY